MIDNRDFFREIAKLELTPVTIRRIVLLLVRLHYSTSKNFGKLSEQMKDYVWNEDPLKRKLQTDYDYNYDAKNLDKKPAIYIGLDDIDYKKTVLENHNKFSYDLSGQHLIKTASTKIIIRHVGTSADEALTLENLTAQFFLGIQPMIRETLPQVLEYEVLRSTSSKPFERTSTQALQEFISDTILAFSYNSAWMVSFESHRIKTISFSQCLAECGKERK